MPPPLTSLSHALTTGLRRASLCFGDVLSDLAPTIHELALQTQQGAAWHPDESDAYCFRCGATTPSAGVTSRGCANCRDARLRWQRLVRLGPYKSPLSDWIVAMKFQRQWSWAPWLGQRLASALPPITTSENVAVCPVPMHWRRRWHRGYNQAHLIAQTIAHQRHWPLVPLLQRVRHTPPQTRIAPSQRHANVRDSFACRPHDLTGWTVWLVDDVKTTGATLNACAKLLQARGAERIFTAVAAVADPRQADFTRS